MSERSAAPSAALEGLPAQPLQPVGAADGAPQAQAAREQLAVSILTMSSPPGVRSVLFNFLTTRDALFLRPVSRDLRSIVADHSWQDGAQVGGLLTCWRTSFPRATVANLRGCEAIDDLWGWTGLKKAYLPAGGVQSALDSDPLALSLLRLTAVAEIII